MKKLIYFSFLFILAFVGCQDDSNFQESQETDAQFMSYDESVQNYPAEMNWKNRLDFLGANPNYIKKVINEWIIRDYNNPAESEDAFVSYLYDNGYFDEIEAIRVEQENNRAMNCYFYLLNPAYDKLTNGNMYVSSLYDGFNHSVSIPDSPQGDYDDPNNLVTKRYGRVSVPFPTKFCTGSPITNPGDFGTWVAVQGVRIGHSGNLGVYAESALNFDNNPSCSWNDDLNWEYNQTAQTWVTNQYGGYQYWNEGEECDETNWNSGSSNLVTKWAAGLHGGEMTYLYYSLNGYFKFDNIGQVIAADVNTDLKVDWDDYWDYYDAYIQIQLGTFTNMAQQAYWSINNSPYAYIREYDFWAANQSWVGGGRKYSNNSTSVEQRWRQAFSKRCNQSSPTVHVLKRGLITFNTNSGYGFMY